MNEPDEHEGSTIEERSTARENFKESNKKKDGDLVGLYRKPQIKIKIENSYATQ